MTTNYAEDSLIYISDDGMNEELWDIARNDAKDMAALDIVNDRERNLLFYLDNFLDDLCEEFGCPGPKNRKEILEKSFLNIKDKEDIDLLKIRKGVYKAVKDLAMTKKFAYPNTVGTSEMNAKPKRDINEWVSTLANIYSAMREGESKMAATERLTEDWDPMAKHDFGAWVRYYEKKDHEKYNIKRTAAPVSPEMPQWMRNIVQPEEEQEVVKRRMPGRPRKRKRTLQESQDGLVGRLDAADKLLREFKFVWPERDWHSLYEALADLKRKIMTMKTEATITDCIIRTANIWNRKGFTEGAEFLKKVAQPPEDIASQIEKALTGKEDEIGGTPPAAAPGMEGLDLPPGLEENAPPMEEGQDTKPPAGAGEELPPAEELPADIKEDVSPPADNPYSGSTVQNALEVLEPVSQKLKERAEVRELSKVDMMLDAMNVAGHFPELGESIARLLENSSYVSTRLEKIISKLKSGLKDGEGDKTPGVPNIEMDELTKGPEELKMPKAPKEREAFEVTEEAPKMPAGG